MKAGWAQGPEGLGQSPRVVSRWTGDLAIAASVARSDQDASGAGSACKGADQTRRRGVTTAKPFRSCPVPASGRPPVGGLRKSKCRKRGQRRGNDHHRRVRPAVAGCSTQGNGRRLPCPGRFSRRTRHRSEGPISTWRGIRTKGPALSRQREADDLK